MFFVLPAIASTVILPEDEVILPPLLSRVRSDLGGAPDGINVIPAKGQKRRAIPGEWFDYGDSLDLPASASFEVIQSEDLGWVGGGGFRGTIGNYSKTQNSLTQYAIAMGRGWVRVWIRPGKFESLIRIEGNGDVFTAKDAEFWLNLRSGASDLYVIRGEVLSKVSDQIFDSGTYVSLKPGRRAPISRSKGWEPTAMEVPIAAAYPGFIRLSAEASKDWDRGRTTGLFGDYRKKGWRKFHRLTPDLKKRE
jgi:hypothetical protein